MSGLGLLIVGVAEKGEECAGFVFSKYPRSFQVARRLQSPGVVKGRRGDHYVRKQQPWYKWTDSLHE